MGAHDLYVENRLGDLNILEVADITRGLAKTPKKER
jgi:hypothetical protein